ncbi:MAG: VCBS repeat-containing protein [Bacteroidetes bacterium]|nr:VCBS repeat-containing protein [Bacteroidota bacterium]MCW5896285.1 VCBS repeat-containing protein [Bacteroidota bacterium]
MASFGPLSDINLGYRPAALAVGFHESGKSELAVIAPELHAVYFYEVHPTGGITHTQVVRTQSILRSITGFSFKDDKRSGYVSILEGGNSISIIKKGPGDSAEEVNIPLSHQVQNCIVADLNNDRRNDILLYGKTAAGVVTFLAHEDGTYKAGPVLFPDISISDLRAADINGDGITDLLALNWLSNQLTIFYGIGKLVFTEQVAVQLPAEPYELAVTPVSKDRTFSVAISFQDAQQIRVYSGNSLGDYRATATLPVGGRPAGLEFSYLNNDEIPDLVSSTSKGILVWLGTSATSFSSRTVFGAGRSIVSWQLADVDGDGKVDCVLLDKTTQRLVCMLNTDYSGSVEATEYAVGMSPMGLVVADFNGNDRVDIAVANSQSSSLSFLFNRGGGRFTGQVVVPISDNPTFLRRASSLVAGQHTVLVSHAKDDKVTVVTVADNARQSKAFSVPTGNMPFVVSANHESDELKFLVRSRRANEKAYSLSLFEQISQRQFVERSLRPTLPTTIAAVNITEEQKHGTFRLLFATNDRTTKRTTVWAGTSDNSFEVTTTSPLFSYPDSPATTRFVAGTHLNGDSLEDVLFVLGPPRNELGVWYRMPQSVGRDSIEWIRNVQPAGDDAIIVRDVNGDTLTDLVFVDALRRAVVVCYGTERRGFRVPQAIVPADGVYSIRVASLRDPGVYDLILSNTERGTVSILSNPFGRRGD